MANLTITINNTIAADVRDTLCSTWNYPGDPQDNVAKLEFVRSRTALWLKDTYRSAKAQIDGETARSTSLLNTNSADIS